MLSSDGQIFLLQNDFRFLKVFQLPKRWKLIKCSSQAVGTKCLAHPHFFILIWVRKCPWNRAQGFPFCSWNSNGDSQTKIDSDILWQFHRNWCDLHACRSMQEMSIEPALTWDWPPQRLGTMMVNHKVKRETFGVPSFQLDPYYVYIIIITIIIIVIIIIYIYIVVTIHIYIYRIKKIMTHIISNPPTPAWPRRGGARDHRRCAAWTCACFGLLWLRWLGTFRRLLSTAPAQNPQLFLLGFETGLRRCFCSAAASEGAPSWYLPVGPQAVSIGLRNCYVARFRQALKASNDQNPPQQLPKGLRACFAMVPPCRPTSCFYWASKLLRGTFSASLKSLKWSKSSAAASEGAPCLLCPGTYL